MPNEPRSAGLRRERTHASPRFREGRFHNSEPLASMSATDVDRSMISTSAEYLLGGAVKRPPAPLPIERPIDAWLRPAPSGLRVTWLGHSTTLVEIDGHRVLTDPVWSERLFPVVGPRRFHPTPVAVADLPPLDAVLVSHDHYDHLDLATVRLLAARQEGVPFYTSLGVGARLEAVGVPPERIVELDWFEEATVATLGRRSALSFTATPSRHFSGRSPFDRNRTLWSSWVIATDRHRVFFSGDTGLTTELSAVGERYGPFDLVMLEVGAYHPSWGQIHLGPENALVAHRMLGGGAFLPVHWGTFDLALHAWDEPIETLTARAADARTHILTPPLGRAIEPAHVERIDPWWRAVAGRHVAGAAPRAALSR